jgi:hypothetical protein
MTVRARRDGQRRIMDELRVSASLYQNIFCGASQGTRQQADGIVASVGN